MWPLLIFAVVGEIAPCKYEDAVCSCKLGEANQGTCWDKLSGVPGTCKSRPCLKGWTCACAGRTHLCPRKDANVNTVALAVSEAAIKPAEAPCNTTVAKKVTAPTLKLGMMNLSISESGVQADKCNKFIWYHNGNLRGDWTNEGYFSLSANDTAAALADRAVHTLLELLPGDLLAFQFTDASYYCYKNLAAISANNLNITTDMVGVQTYYAREPSDYWFAPNFTMNATTLGNGTEESEIDRAKFLVPRKFMLDNTTDGSLTPVVPGTDYWQPDDGSADHAVANWYWRIHIPTDLPDPTGGAATF